MNEKFSWKNWFAFVREMAIKQEIKGEQLTEFLKEEYQYYQKVEDRFNIPIDRRLTEDDFIGCMTEDIEADIKKMKAAA